MNKRFLKSSLLVVVSFFAMTGLVFAGTNMGGDASGYGQLQDTLVVFNNSGATLTSGQIVVLDRTGTGVTAGTTLGAYVTTVGTGTADSTEVVGVVKGGETCPDQTPCIVVTKGPVQALCNNLNDQVTTGSGVGTAGSGPGVGRCGGGTKLGIALQTNANARGDGNLVWIWVKPTNGD